MPERERLLLAMADVTPEMRDEFERFVGEERCAAFETCGARHKKQHAISREHPSGSSM